MRSAMSRQEITEGPQAGVTPQSTDGKQGEKFLPKWTDNMPFNATRIP